jgi:hypothetical protein
MEDENMKTTYKLSGNPTPGKAPGRFSHKFGGFLMLAILSLFTLISFSTRAFHPASSELNIHLHDNSVFNITINNTDYRNFTNNYTITNLAPGRHFVRVTRFKASFNGYSYRYEFPQIVFEGHINIRPKTRIFAHIDNRGRFRIEQSLAMHTSGPPAHAAIHKRPRPYKTPVNQYTYYAPGMNPHTFNMLKNTIFATSFDSSKLNIAKQAIADNTVTSEQVYQLMMMMSFESNRLNLAQFAYYYTVDKGNYFIVHNAFNFNSSSNRLNTYIAQLR